MDKAMTRVEQVAVSERFLEDRPWAALPVGWSGGDPATAFEDALWARVRAKLQEVQAPPLLLSRIRAALALEDAVEWEPWKSEGAR